MKKTFLPIISLLLLVACNEKQNQPKITASEGSFVDPVKIAMTGELPSKEAIPVLFDEMDYQQAVQCYLWAFPMVSFESMKETQEKVFGATQNDIVAYNSYEDKLGILTANATTPYILSYINLAKTGPLVIELPAGAVAGALSDCWQREVTPIGETGAKDSKESKYLLSTPGSAGIKASGYTAIPFPTANFSLGIRALDPDPKKSEALINAVKIYPYEQRNNPAKTKVITPSGKKYLMTPPDGMAYWQVLYNILQDEPIEERDRFFVAWLDNLGIKKGQAFNPTEKQKQILTAAAERGKLMGMANSFNKRFENKLHWNDRKWDYVTMMSEPSQRGANFDEFFQRTAWFFEAIGYTKAMVTKTPNMGQAYLGAYEDKDGKWLDGGQNYTLHVSPNPPALNFWSITLYDVTTRCFVDNTQRNADLSSRKDLIKNGDGSVDLYFGPKAPQGKEKNWIQTVEGKHWFAYFRLYAPTPAYFDKSWKMGDIEKVK